MNLSFFIVSKDDIFWNFEEQSWIYTEMIFFWCNCFLLIFFMHVFFFHSKENLHFSTLSNPYKFWAPFNICHYLLVPMQVQDIDCQELKITLSSLAIITVWQIWWFKLPVMQKWRGSGSFSSTAWIILSVRNGWRLGVVQLTVFWLRRRLETTGQ